MKQFVLSWSHSLFMPLSLIAVVFHVLREGIVARFVATDGGITRVYPRRYCFYPPSTSFTSSISAGVVKQHGMLCPNIGWCKCVQWKQIQTVLLLSSAHFGCFTHRFHWVTFQNIED